MTKMQSDNHPNHEKPAKQFTIDNPGTIQKYIELFDRMPIGIYRTTQEGKLLSANPVFISMLGYSDNDDIDEIDISTSHPSPEKRLEFIAEIEEHGDIRGKESVMVRKDGQEIVVEEYATLHRNKCGDVICYEGIIIDVTHKIKDRDRIVYLGRFKELIARLTNSFVNVRFSDVDDLIVDALKHIGLFIGADRSYVFLFEEKELIHMSNTHEWVNEGIRPVKDELQDLETKQFPWWMDHLLKSRHIIIPNIMELPTEAGYEKEVFMGQSIISMIAVPIFFNYELIGFLGFDMVRQQRTFDIETAELLNIAGGMFASAITFKHTDESFHAQQKKLQQLVYERTESLEVLNKKLSDEIMERKKLHNDLEQSNAKYKLLADKSNDVIWTMDASLNTTYMSPSVERHLGFSAEEYLSMSVQERLPQESFMAIKNAVSEKRLLIEQGADPSEQEFTIEILHKTRDGQELWGEVNVRFLADESGKFSGLHGITRNIHERKLAQIELWENRNRFQALVENTSDWIWEVDKDGMYTYCSPVVEKMLGYLPEEVLGKHFSDFLEEKKKQSVKAQFDNFLQARLPFQSLENIALHKNGRKVILETSAVPVFDMHENFIGYRGIDRDVTDEKKIQEALRFSEKKLYQHLQKTPMGYIEWDMNKEVLEWNPAAQHIFGYSKIDAMIGNAFANIVPEDLRPEVERIWQEISSGEPAIQSVNENQTKDGKRIICNWYNTPLVDENERVIGVSCLVQDITESASVQMDYEEFINFFELSTDIILVTSTEYFILQANTQADTYIGLNSYPDKIFNSMKDIYTDESWQEFESEVLPALAKKQIYKGKKMIRSVDRDLATDQVIIATYDDQNHIQHIAFVIRVLDR